MFGSYGERELQSHLGSQQRASRFYDRQMRDQLTEKMQALIKRQEMVFISTADAQGNCDSSPRFGKPGFVAVLDEHTLAYPEFRGNGVFASLGNILENPHIGLLFLDFFDTTVGLHVNGQAQYRRPKEAPESVLAVAGYGPTSANPLVEGWVVIKVDEAYLQCSKHVPRLRKEQKEIDWGTDDPQAKSDDYFLSGESLEVGRSDRP